MHATRTSKTEPSSTDCNHFIGAVTVIHQGRGDSRAQVSAHKGKQIQNPEGVRAYRWSTVGRKMYEGAKTQNVKKSFKRGTNQRKSVFFKSREVFMVTKEARDFMKLERSS